jgi:hypothetical protein
MRLNQPETNLSPPPLPPRVRKNTDCSSLQRSYTTPESEMSKKKWNLFDVFGKSKRLEAKKRDRPIQIQPRELQLLKAKRNSFSSPDLSHLDVSFNNSGCANCSFDLENPSNISSSNSFELENLCEEEQDEKSDANISHNIKPNFELKLNNDISTVNLVGCNYNLNQSLEESSPRSQPSPGYLEMRPGKGFDVKKVEELDNQLKNDVLYRLKYSFDSPITYKRESDYDRPAPIESHYVCMNGKASPSQKPKIEEPTYTVMTRIPSETYQNVYQIKSTNSPSSVGNKRLSVDDKIASYFPNYDVPAKTNGFSSHVRSSTSEGIRKTPPTIKSSEMKEKSMPIKIPSRQGKRGGSFSIKSLNDNNNNSSSQSPEISKKYATISRLTVKDPLDDQLSPAIKKSDSVSPTSIKRFTSLPRFKKIDFSPLRLKISSVLQRNNPGC